ncbi:tumor protein p53-inducible protein 11-like isoform X2 [Tachypleus tridentatus]|uniref:tumor protein p53-inducible protein 11-like isoform X2 n=1 Tax=Tachypleus tridentatus TaxID=6853 RepID=UPI003FD63AD8
MENKSEEEPEWTMKGTSDKNTLEEPESTVPYRKHSSGDLHSRLKTRKILGVGETDNGDIHRSKISQVLGHNEHLFVKFPRGFQVWHLSVAIIFTLCGLMLVVWQTNALEEQTSNIIYPFLMGGKHGYLLRDVNIIHQNLFLPDQWYDITLKHQVIGDLNANLATRFYGITLLALAFVLWSFWGTYDKNIARVLLSAVALCHFLQLIAMILHTWNEGELRLRRLLALVVRLILVSLNGYFYWALGRNPMGIRKSASFKDLRDVNIRPPPSDSSGQVTSVSAVSMAVALGGATDTNTSCLGTKKTE